VPNVVYTRSDYKIVMKTAPHAEARIDGTLRKFIFEVETTIAKPETAAHQDVALYSALFNALIDIGADFAVPHPKRVYIVYAVASPCPLSARYDHEEYMTFLQRVHPLKASAVYRMNPDVIDRALHK
jgi:hypothetical protein